MPANRREIARTAAKWLAVVALGLFAHDAKAGQVVNPSAGQNNPWLQEHLLNAKSQLPFSFVYGRQLLWTLLQAWPQKTALRQLDAGRTEHTLVWSDPKTGLHVRLTAVEFAGSPLVEWEILSIPTKARSIPPSSRMFNRGTLSLSDSPAARSP